MKKNSQNFWIWIAAWEFEKCSQLSPCMYVANPSLKNFLPLYFSLSVLWPHTLMYGLQKLNLYTFLILLTIILPNFQLLPTHLHTKFIITSSHNAHSKDFFGVSILWHMALRTCIIHHSWDYLIRSRKLINLLLIDCQSILI